jgi:hypothetical protein
VRALATFRPATALLFLLAIFIITVNAVGWVSVRRLYRRLRSPSQVENPPQRFWNLSTVIRIEAAYFAVLLVYWIMFPGVLGTLPVMFAVTYHFPGFAGDEWAGLARRSPF